MAEEANLKATYHPGKEGGTFGLPLGGKVIVGEGVCGRKDWVSCTVASPADRWRHKLSFPGEHVTSEIFTLSGTILKQQRSAILILPFYQPEGKYVELTAKALWGGESGWSDVPFVIKGDSPQPCVEVEVNRGGSFLVTCRTRTDPVQLTPQGGLFHCRLNRNISLRFPKKALDCNVRYDLKVIEVPEERLHFCKHHFSITCSDLLRVSEFIDLHPSVLQCNFRRNATIKLPLPEGTEVDSDSANEIVVLHKERDCWEWLNTKYKFTRNSVSFDVKNPNKFCVVQTCRDQRRKMQEAVTVLEQYLDKQQTDLSLFLSLTGKSWQAVVECYPLRDTPTKLSTRKAQGFTIIKKSEPPPPLQNLPPTPNKTLPPRRLAQRGEKTPEGSEVHDGLTWTLEVSGDLQGTPRSEMSANSGLQCFRRLRDSYRRFILEPTTKEERSLRGTITLTPVGVEESVKLDLTFQFHVEVPEQVVKDYFFVETPVEPEPEPEAEVKVVESSSNRPRKVVAPAAPKKRVFTFTQTPMERLTQPPRRFSTLDREARVLNGKSLTTLSKLVDNGVALAIELGLKESTVSGIGFDTMSCTRSLSDMTYKILLYWKRTCKLKHDGAVQQLAAALRQMGKGNLATIVLDRHRDNRELSMEVFLEALATGVDLSV
ncbi:hypothetical protein ACOMHN_040193 [Nucella lapillus]